MSPIWDGSPDSVTVSEFPEAGLHVRPLPDGDVLGALAREWRAVPVAPSLDEGQTGDFRHEVEFGGPCVSVRRIEPNDAIADGEEVRRNAALGRGVQRVESHVTLAHVERQRRRTGRKGAQVRDDQLDDEPSAGGQVVRGIAEALHGLVLVQEVRDRVEHEIDERKLARNRGGREIADGRRNRRRARLRAELGDHVLRDVDAGDLDTARRQRQRHPPRTDGELERAAP